MRRLSVVWFKDKKPAMYSWPQQSGFWRTIKNFLVIQLGRYCPFLSLKSWMYRHLLGMQLGNRVAFGLMAMVDIFHPEMISIGENTTLGYNCTILTHEYLIDQYRTGPVQIGANVLIGANSTILPGVVIGDGAIIGAGAVVTKDIPPGVLAVGIPAIPVEEASL